MDMPCNLVMNKYNLPIAAFTKSYLKDLKPAIKFRREKIRAQKEIEKAVFYIFRNEEKREAKKHKALKLAAKQAAKQAAARAKILKKIDDTGYGIVFERETSSIEYLKKIYKDIPELRRADKELTRRLAREAKLVAKQAKVALKKANKAKKKLEAERKKIEALKKTNAWIQATKHAKTVVRREMLEMLNDIERGDYDITDAITELEHQLQ